jgi:hypothetical protein
MTDRIVLGLDQSMHTGFCVGEPGAKTPKFGLWSVPDYAGNEGRTFWAFEKWLVNLIKSEGVTHVFWEGVWFPPQARLDTNKLFKLVSYANAIQAACEDERAGLSVPNQYVPVSEWRKVFNGTAKGGTDFQKQAALQSCLQHGWLTESHHVAEAIGIWFFGCMCVDKKFRWLNQSAVRRQQEARNGQLSKENART